MTKDRSYDLRDIAVSREPEQSLSLLAQGAVDDDELGLTPAHRPPSFPQSSLSRTASNGSPRIPRTINRVRFDVGETDSGGHALNGHARTPSCKVGDWPEAEGDFSGNILEHRGSGAGQRVPLLTDVEAPSVMVAEDLDFNAEGLLENARPKSGITSAGIILLVVLTITVDWTIRQDSPPLSISHLFDAAISLFLKSRARVDVLRSLIVVNSKLSGANSFQGTVEHCFGASGLVAISMAQGAFAFGGMVAFCVIMGDSIPSVNAALFPSLSDMPFLWLLTNRRAVIIIILITVVTQGVGVPPDLKGDLRGSLFVRNGVFQAISHSSAVRVPTSLHLCSTDELSDHNSLLIYGSLKKPTMDRFTRVTHYSTFTSMLACLTMALAGFIIFGEKTQGNILNNFPNENLMVNIARLRQHGDDFTAWSVCAMSG
ncbi:MAG: hypothetical protein ASARMPREDX12_009085 [Alectoria sarmentosa]|nr:MAG: hypothetical protein ASARMPREDX12_009085 [Alectoria sarmentosa]